MLFLDFSLYEHSVIINKTKHIFFRFITSYKQFFRINLIQFHRLQPHPFLRMKDKDYLKKLALNITRIRKEKGITQVALAYSCGFDKQNMQR
jgi:hypothetical protein